jgi:hypothetical protein
MKANPLQAFGIGVESKSLIHGNSFKSKLEQALDWTLFIQ